MKLLFTGRGTSGSWQIRGDQVGHAVGATVMPNAQDVAGYDAAIVVKRAPPDLVARIHAAGVPLLWDVVDAWPQPLGNHWSHEQCMQWLSGQIAEIRPAGIVAATGVMAADLAEFGLPVLCLPHHARPGQAINPIRKHVKAVGYEGGVKYLGKWQRVLERECKARDWQFVLNPQRLADLDIVVAFREAIGYAALNWKSNVKLANAQATGTPFIGQRASGYAETATGGEYFADTHRELTQALDVLADNQARANAHELLMRGEITLESAAATYRAWLNELT